jgi:hypothetical protein
MARESGASSNPQRSRIQLTQGLLDRPVKPGDDTEVLRFTYTGSVPLARSTSPARYSDPVIRIRGATS